MTLGDAYTYTVRKFEQYNVPFSSIEPAMIIGFVLNMPVSSIYISKERNVTTDEVNNIKALVTRRCNREPLQYILGEMNFMGLDFKVDKRALIPRYDTEVLVEEALSVIRDMKKETIRVLDVGTGTGCIAITIAHEDKRCKLTAIDISRDALILARYNAIKNIAEQDIKFVCMDALEADFGDEKFDVIVSNPPYIGEGEKLMLDPEVLEHEPDIALFADNDGLAFYEKFIPRCPELLNPEGYVLLEIGYRQGSEISKLFKNTKKLGNVKIIKDFQQKDRVVKSKIL